MNSNDGQTTGEVRVDAALARFDELAEAPLTTHPEIFEDVHRRLQDALTGIEQDPPPGPGEERPREQDAQPSGIGQERDAEDVAQRLPHVGRDRDLPPDAEGDTRGWPER